MSNNASDAGRQQPPAKDGTFSLEDLDKIIESEDPNFAKEMEGLRSQAVEASAALEDLSIKTDDDDEPDSKDEGQELTRKQKVLRFLSAPFRKLWAYLGRKARSFGARLVLAIDSFKTFVRHELPERIKYFKSQVIRFFGYLKSLVLIFKGYTGLQKTAIIFGLFSTAFSIFILVQAVKGSFLPRYIDPLPRSLLELSEFKGNIRDSRDMQDFFEAFPEVEYYILLKKVVVNLRPDENTGPNPMGIFEFYVGVDAKDTAVEVKDRENEMLDSVQRTIEGFAYSEVASQMGKARLKSAIRDNLNRLLNQGMVFKIYFNTIVIYSNN